MQKMMDNNTWLTAREAKEFGLIDEIIHDTSTQAANFRGSYESAMALYNSVKLPNLLILSSKSRDWIFDDDAPTIPRKNCAASLCMLVGL